MIGIFKRKPKRVIYHFFAESEVASLNGALIMEEINSMDAHKEAIDAIRQRFILRVEGNGYKPSWDEIVIKSISFVGYEK